MQVARYLKLAPQSESPDSISSAPVVLACKSREKVVELLIGSDLESVIREFAQYPTLVMQTRSAVVIECSEDSLGIDSNQ